MAEVIVESLEVIDVDEQDAQWTLACRSRRLGLGEEILECKTIGQSGQHVGFRALFGMVQRDPDLAEFLGGLNEVLLQLARPGYGFRKLRRSSCRR